MCLSLAQQAISMAVLLLQSKIFVFCDDFDYYHNNG